jgi:pimeloyl-ACP methyl ester carboxylesterase
MCARARAHCKPWHLLPFRCCCEHMGGPTPPGAKCPHVRTNASYNLIQRICGPHLCRCRVVAPDLRGHGLSSSADDADLSAATLAADVVAIWRQLFASSADVPASGAGSLGGVAAGTAAGAAGAAGQAAAGTAAASAAPGAADAAAGGGGGGGSQEAPGDSAATVLIGHSMGGAVAVHAAALNGEGGFPYIFFDSDGGFGQEGWMGLPSGGRYVIVGRC